MVALKIGKGFGKRLRKIRKAAGLTQAALGLRAGVHPVSIAQYETGVCNPSEKTAEKLRVYFEELQDKSVDPPAAATPKKRRRTKKAKTEFALDPKTKHRLDNLGAVMKTRADVEKHADAMLAEFKKPKGLKRAKRRFYEEKVEPAADAIVARQSYADGAELSKSPVRLGRVSLAWVEQQVDAHVHARGMVFIDGPSRIVAMRRADLIGLGKMILEACGVKAGEDSHE